MKLVGGNIMLLDCFSAKATGRLHHIGEKMDGAMYHKIFHSSLPSYVEALKMSRGLIFQRDDDPQHKPRVTEEWLCKNLF